MVQEQALWRTDPLNSISQPAPWGWAVEPRVSSLTVQVIGKLAHTATRFLAAVTESFTFLSYCIPVLGGIVSDTKWGRFKVSQNH